MPKEGSTRRVELQHKEVEDILGRVPGWITRNGILLFFIVLALLLFGSWVFRYPDVKRARIVVTSVNPPADLKARTTGTIMRLFVQNNEEVREGQVLAMLENPASYEDVVRLKNSLKFLDTIDIHDIANDLPELRNAELGTIQTDYSLFLKAYRDYMEFLRIDYHQRRIATARSELEKQRALSRTLTDRSSIQEESYEMVSRQFDRDVTLYEQGVIATSNLEESRSAMLVEQNKLQEIRSSLAENNISIARTENDIVDLELKQQEESSGMISTLEESLNNLKASISSWEQNFLLVAPVSGSVTATRFWSVNQNVQAGEKVLTIVPAESGSLLGKISLPLEGAGKVKVGAQVNIQFDNYPHLEYGMVRGTVSNIPAVPDEDFYTVEVEFPEGLRTYYDIPIQFSQNMQGNAEIFTDKKRMLMRVLNPIRSAISKQLEM
jgi:multidrug resistance efflux pump